MRNIYEVMDFADSAYIMHQGRLWFELSPDDRYSVESKGIIFGAEEPLIANKTGRDEYFRFQSAYVSDDASVEKIPLKNLFKVFAVYNIGYSITKNIARYLQITNRMYINKEKKISGFEMASKEYARIYVEVIENLKKTHSRLLIGWLKQLVDKYTNSLVYTKGRAFLRDTAKSNIKFNTEKLSEYTFNLRAGSILCEEGDAGHEMYILNRGNLVVYIGGKKVADINEAGTVIGEMALLLGERRTATIKTVTDCNITIVKPEDLEKVAKTTDEFLLNVAVNLGRRLEHNCTLIRETNELLLESKKSERPLPPRERTNYKELLALVRELEHYEIKYKNDWMSEILNWIKSEINKVRELYK